MRKCIWTAKDSETLILVDRSEELYAEAQFVSRARRYLEKAQKIKYVFLGVLALLVATMVGAVLMEQAYVLHGALMVLGGILVAMPYATPQTIQMIGIRKSVVLVRLIGLGLMSWALFNLL